MSAATNNLSTSERGRVPTPLALQKQVLGDSLGPHLLRTYE